MIRIAVFLTLMIPTGYAQTGAPRTVLLWPDGAPGAQGNAPEDIPSLTIFAATGSEKVPTAVVVCPGGGYAHLADVKEGSDIAKWLNERGIAAFVL
ncbi:MAG: alpha/beta hydrolase, partial [Bryobacteraceae bacterium]